MKRHYFGVFGLRLEDPDQSLIMFRNAEPAGRPCPHLLQLWGEVRRKSAGERCSICIAEFDWSHAAYAAEGGEALLDYVYERALQLEVDNPMMYVCKLGLHQRWETEEACDEGGYYFTEGSALFARDIWGMHAYAGGLEKTIR